MIQPISYVMLTQISKLHTLQEQLFLEEIAQKKMWNKEFMIIEQVQIENLSMLMEIM